MALETTPFDAADYLADPETAVEYLRLTLEEIRDFGFAHSGHGFSCAKMAAQALDAVGRAKPTSAPQ